MSLPLSRILCRPVGLQHAGLPGAAGQCRMDLPIEWLPANGQAEQLVLLLHGWGQGGAAMAPLAQVLRAQFPQAALLAPDAPLPAVSQPGAPTPAPDGRAWWAIRTGDGDALVSGAAGGVQACLPALHSWITAQQQRLRVAPPATCLAGFSQGAALALALSSRYDGLCGRVLAFGGRYAEMPLAAPQRITIHLFHGEADAVIPAVGSRAAFEHLAALQGDATLDIARGVGHTLHPALLQCALRRLQTHIPLRTWREALGGAPSTR
jgi:phospholipase/carboxylesterase